MAKRDPTRLTHALMQAIVPKEHRLYADKKVIGYDLGNYRFMAPKDDSHAWHVYQGKILRHSVTHLEEMIGMAYNDGLHDGMDEAKQELRDWLQVKGKYEED